MTSICSVLLTILLATCMLGVTTANDDKNGEKNVWDADDSGKCYNKEARGISLLSCEAGKELGEQLKALYTKVKDINDIVTANQDVIDSHSDVMANVTGGVESPENGPEQPKSCLDVKQYDQEDGVRTLSVNGVKMEVFCDQQTAGGGWTVMQRRVDGSVDFYRNWTEYENGFGDLQGEFWLGLSNIYRLTSSQNYALRVDAEAASGETYSVEFSHFSISGPNDFYRLNVSEYSIDGGSSMGTQNNQQFTTKDADHDTISENCATKEYGAWWYSDCGNFNPNGLYKKDEVMGDDAWRNIEDLYPITSISMKIRPAS